MPTITPNDDGTWNILRDDGVSVRAARLPPGLQATAPAPSAPAPTPLQSSPVDALLSNVGGPGAPPPPVAPAPTPAAPTDAQRVAEFVEQSAPANPYATRAAVDELMASPMGFGRKAPPPADPSGPPREFNGWTGDPAVVQRTPDGRGYQLGGRSGPGGYGTTGTAARSDIGGTPPARVEEKQWTPEDFASAPPAVSASAPAGAPGGTVRTSAVRFTPSPPSKAQQATDAAFLEQQKAIAARRALGEQEAAQEAGRLDGELQAERDRQAQEAARQAEARKGVDEARAKLSQAVENLSTPEGELDPDRWWNSRTTGQRMASIASAFLQGVAGRPSIISEMIDRDIAAQRFNLERKDKTKAQAVEGARTLLQVARDNFSDELMQQSAARSMAASISEKIIQRQAAGLRGEEAKVRAQEMLADLAATKARADAELEQRAQQLALQRAEFAMRVQAQQAAQVAQARSMAAEGAQGPVEVGILTPEQRKRAIVIGNGRAMLALSEDAAKKGTDAWIAGNELLNVLDRGISLRREFGSEKLPTAARTQMQTVGTVLIGALNKRNKFGALDNGTQDLLKKMAGGELTDFGNVDAALQEIRDLAVTDINNEILSYTGTAIRAPTPRKPASK